MSGQPPQGGVELTDDEQIAVMLGASPALVGLWRSMDSTFVRVGDALEVRQGDTVVGRRRLDQHGRPDGPYEVVVNTI